MFWVRFGDSGWKKPRFHNAGEADTVRRWLEHRRSMSAIETYSRTWIFDWLPSDWAEEGLYPDV